MSRSDERVLDVGTGGGVLLIGAARRASFEELGLSVDQRGTAWGTFPFQRVVIAKKQRV